MRIRAMTESDQLIIRDWVIYAHQHGEIWALGWSFEKLESSFLTSMVWVAGDGAQVHGFLIVREPGAAWEVDLVAVRPECRRRGILRSLIGVLENEAARRERESDPNLPRSIWLEVHEHNHPAISAYLSLGFECTGRRPTYYSDGGAALLMTKV